MRLQTRLATFAAATAAFVSFVAMPVSPAAAATVPAPPVITDPVIQAQVEEIVNQYVDVTRVENTTTTIVTFADKAGKKYEYAFDNEGLTEGDDESSAEGAVDVSRSSYTTTLTGWKLNKRETRELASDGSQMALVYAIGVAMGCGACAVGAAVEGHWASTASSAVSQGKCVWLKFWFTAAAYSGKACK
jgi:hypothetical protein